MAILSKASIVNLNSTITDMKSSVTVNVSFNAAAVSKTSLNNNIPSKSFSFGAPNTGLAVSSLSQSQSGQRHSNRFNVTRQNSNNLKPNVDPISTNSRVSTTKTAPLYSTGATRIHASLVVKQDSETSTSTSTSPSKLATTAKKEENTVSLSKLQSELKTSAQKNTQNEKSALAGSGAKKKGRVRVSVSTAHNPPSKINTTVRRTGTQPATNNTNKRVIGLNSTVTCRIGLKSRACLKRVLSISAQPKANSNSNSDSSGSSTDSFIPLPCRGANNMTNKFLQRAQTLMIYRTKKPIGKAKETKPDLKLGFQGSLDEMVQRFRNSKCWDGGGDDHNSNKKRKDMSLPTENERDILKFLIAKQVYNEIKIETVQDLKDANQNRPRRLDAYGLGRSIIEPPLDLFQSAHSFESGSLREETISGYNAFKERVEDIEVENYYSQNDEQIVCVFIPDLINKNEIGSIECDRLEQAIKVLKACMKPTGYLLWVKCGSPHEWHNPKNPFRTDPELMLKTLPSIKVWGTQKDLVGCKIFKMENLVTLLED